MQHETFHDTTNLKKRKPNRLRGTPANKYSHALSLACVCGFTLACHFFTTTEWMQPTIERFFERTAPSPYQEVLKLRMNDIFMNSVLRNAKLREENEVPEHETAYSSANY